MSCHGGGKFAVQGEVNLGRLDPDSVRPQYVAANEATDRTVGKAFARRHQIPLPSVPIVRRGDDNTLWRLPVDSAWVVTATRGSAFSGVRFCALDPRSKN
jgi:hypothetical protein